jgi:hypothetical protein
MTDTQASAAAPGTGWTGWIGWVFLAATLLLIAAGVRIFRGIMGVLGPDAAYAIARGARNSRRHRSG